MATEEQKKRWGWTGKRKGGPGRRVHDWDLYRDIVDMPRRDSLPQDGPERKLMPGSGMFPSLTGNVVDNRSDERRAWDQRMEALQQRIIQNRKTEADERERVRKRGIQSRVAGRPMDETGNPVEEAKPADEPQQESSEKATAAPAQGNKLSNGQPKAGQPGTAQGQASALTPRKAGPDPNIGSTPSRWNKNANRSSGVTVNGAPVYNTDSATNANIRRANDAITNVAAMRAEDQEQLKNAESARTPYEAYQVGQNARERIEQMGKDRRARQAAEREAAAQRRADKRFADRTLYNEADWRNLGRAEGNNADYSARKEGESNESWNAREKAIKERQGRMDALLKRLDDMGVQDAEKNSFYANDPNKQQNLARLRGLIVGDDGKVRGDITDAQIEGANATLDAWKKGAAEKGARNAALREMSKAEEVSRLRDLYGLQYTGAGGYTGDEVLKFHQDRQAEARKKILQGMQVAPGMTPNSEETTPSADQRPAAMQKFSQDWQKLIDNGFNPTATFQEAMTKGGMRDAYDAGMKTLDVNDPDYRDKADQLRRRFTVQYAMQQAGVGGEGGAERGKAGARFSEPAEDDQFLGQAPGDNVRQMGRAMAQNLPGSAVTNPREAVNIENPLPPRQTQKTPGVQIAYSMADAIKARDAANAAAGIPLKKKRTDGGMLS